MSQTDCRSSCVPANINYIAVTVVGNNSGGWQESSSVQSSGLHPGHLVLNHVINHRPLTNCDLDYALTALV